MMQQLTLDFTHHVVSVIVTVEPFVATDADLPDWLFEPDPK
jgi:hypothetical protein